MNFFFKKKILVTGGTGTIGSEIVRSILKFQPSVVRILSNDENAHFNLQQELQTHGNVRFLIGDIRDKERILKAVEDIDIVFHAAALKHVPLCEYNPFEAIKTNVIGTQNVIEVALSENVEKFVMISTDKAANPINVLGTTKLLAEKLTISANYYKGSKRTIFLCTRFGNVLNSRGSVLPLFLQQIQKGGPITITDPNMTRFVMDIQRAVKLVFEAVEMSHGGEIFIFKMPALRIEDLAKAIIEESAPRYGYDSGKIKIKIIGERVGEKQHEDLMTEEEAHYADETEDMFIIQSPMIKPVVNNVKKMVKRYWSKDAHLLTIEEIKKMLRNII